MCRVKLFGQVLLELSRGLTLVKLTPKGLLNGVETATFFLVRSPTTTPKHKKSDFVFTKL